jgi:hypothetical protein
LYQEKSGNHVEVTGKTALCMYIILADVCVKCFLTPGTDVMYDLRNIFAKTFAILNKITTTNLGREK